MEIESVNLLSYGIAFVAGLISFLSPCVLPVVPGYLSVITGLDITSAEEEGSSQSWPIARDTGLFIAGFSAVFIGLGLSASAVGDLLFENQLLLTRLSGFLVFAMGLFLIGSIVTKNPRFYQEARFHPDLGRFGRAAPPVAGAAFGFGWTPCIGPVLGSILLIAAQADSTFTGGSLLAAYSLGLGVPFLATGLLFTRLAGAFDWVKNHMQQIVWLSGLSLVGFGVLLMTNQLIRVTTELQDALRAVGLEWIVNLG
ncbi:MAG: cytochrome c biogenesis CcdA family protein [Acidimicrobiales bacterium]